MAQAFDPATALEHTKSRGLASISFIGLLVTQALTATNDNVFRWLVIGISKDFVRPDQVELVLAVGSACFLLPYLLLAAPAGYFADRFNKRRVIVTCKMAEIVLMGLAVAAIVWGNIWLLFAVLLLMGAQSALFSPAKLGSIPEMLRPEKISSANGLMGLTTVVAISIGAALGNVLTDATGEQGQERWWLSAIVLLGIAVVGWVTSLWIAELPPGNATRHFPWNAAQQTWRDLRRLASSRPMLRVALGMMFFWSLALLAQLNIDRFASEGGASLQSHTAPMLLALVFGVGVGSVLAGIWSGGRVELGILPIGAFGVVVFSLLLFTVDERLFDAEGWTGSYALACVLLAGLGMSAGLFDVPLSAYMQHRSEPSTRGSILAANNFLTFLGMIIMSGVFYLLRSSWLFGEPMLTSRQIFLLCSIFTVPVFIYIIWLIPQSSIRFFVWLASHTLYRIRVYGHDNLPAYGGALIVSNHVSWLDGILYLMTSSRPVRILAWAGNFRANWFRRLAHYWGVILLEPSRPKALQAALEEARTALLNGELVCIFPEGGITRDGQLQPFKPGLLKILEGTNVPVVPAYLDELWGSIFSFEGGKFFWKWPRRWPYPISIHFGKPVEQPLDVSGIRRAVEELGATAVQHRNSRKAQLTRQFLRSCRQRRRKTKVADSTGVEATGTELLMRSLILRRLLRRHVLAADETHVGLLLPPSMAGAVANAALALDHRVAVNLNATLTSEALNYCIAQAGIRHVLTSQKVLEKLDLKLDCEVVCLEDLRGKLSLQDKIAGWYGANVMPIALLERMLGLQHVQPDDVVTVIFTSGSTGKPKGVMLTYGNVAHNVEAIDQVVQLTSDDVVLGILPFFHSFGYTVTLWTVLSLDVQGAYHFSPRDARQIGKLCKQYGGTILLSTPTFLRMYFRRCTKEEFATLDVVVAGAEKLPKDVADEFEAKFGVRPVEGYGTTELAPLVSVNVPPSRARADFREGLKEGSVGRPVPGVLAKITDLETGQELGPKQPGMLWIKGPNVMKGYLNQPELTAEKVHDDWYQTGDVAYIDEDGFIFITGRISRFSKIGGEMVSHVALEEPLNQLVGTSEDGKQQIAVTSVSHPTKGERLVVVHGPIEQTPDQLCQGLRQAGLPNISIPSPDSFIQVDEVPQLPTGKLDLVALRKVAEERFAHTEVTEESEA